MTDLAAWLSDFWGRLQPAGALTLDSWVAAAAAAALAFLAVPALWRWARIGVTVVHELGHAVVGVAAGRRFTGLVVRPDMSGHAVTHGPPRGLGLVASTWAGYPAPALTGAALARLALGGWSPALLGLATMALLLALTRARSVFTAVAVTTLAAATGALWWLGSPQLQGSVVFAAGGFLVAGAWRHLAAVAAHPTSQSDPGILARLTGVPRVVWVASHAVVIGLATWWLVTGILAVTGTPSGSST